MRTVTLRLCALAAVLALTCSALAPCLCRPSAPGEAACHAEDGLRLSAPCCCSTASDEIQALSTAIAPVTTAAPAPVPLLNLVERTPLRQAYRFDASLLPPRLTLRI